MEGELFGSLFASPRSGPTEREFTIIPHPALFVKGFLKKTFFYFFSQNRLTNSPPYGILIMSGGRGQKNPLKKTFKKVEKTS